MFLSQAIEGFLLDRDGEAEDDLSPKTLALYRGCLSAFVNFLKDPLLENLRAEDLSRFMQYLERDYVPKRKGIEKISGYYRDNFWKSIRSFCNWASREFSIPRIDLAMPRPAYAEEEIIPYSEDEVRIILDACEHTKPAETRGRRSFRMRRPTAIRDRAIILLLLETGIRLGELSRLKIENVNLEAGEIYVKPYRTGKKSRSRTIPFEKGCKKALWRHKIKSLGECEPYDLFFPMASHTVQSFMYRLEHRTGIPNVYAHRFRHTMAIQYLRNGGDIFTLQRILGHSSLVMVRRYLAIAQSDIKDAHRRASPVDRWKL